MGLERTGKLRRCEILLYFKFEAKNLDQQNFFDFFDGTTIFGDGGFCKAFCLAFGIVSFAQTNANEFLQIRGTKFNLRTDPSEGENGKGRAFAARKQQAIETVNRSCSSRFMFS